MGCEKQRGNLEPKTGREKNNIQRARKLFPLKGKSFSLFQKVSISQIGLGGSSGGWLLS